LHFWSHHFVSLCLRFANNAIHKRECLCITQFTNWIFFVLHFWFVVCSRVSQLIRVHFANHNMHFWTFELSFSFHVWIQNVAQCINDLIWCIALCVARFYVDCARYVTL
jgi:hypothetical protein